MKHFINVIIASLFATVVFFLVGCDNKEIGEGSNQKTSGHLSEENYGPIINKGIRVSDIKVIGRQLGDTGAAIDILDVNIEHPEMVTFVCDSRAGDWGLAHNINQPDGTPANLNDDSEIAIINYPAGTKDIRLYDKETVVFSTAQGDVDIAVGLKAIGKLDPNSVIAFVIDKEQDGKTELAPYAWSHLYKVKDLISGLKKVDLSICSKSVLDENTPTMVQYTDPAHLIKLIKSGKL